MKGGGLMQVSKQLFGTIDQTPVYAYTMKNNNGIEVTCIEYGCIITKIITPDQNGKLENIVLGFDTLDDYLERSPFFGCVVGRVAGRISGGSFTLEDRTYDVAKNENGNHLHGGVKGFDKIVWNSSYEQEKNVARVIFTYLSPDGEEGYPGNLAMKITYTLTNEDEFMIHYEGKSDEKTLLNITNHSYFNLSGDLKTDILDHTLTLKSDKFLELDEELLPTGTMLDVEGTPFDFREGQPIRTSLLSDHPQNKLAGGGYDHPFVLNTNHNNEIVLEDETSGRTMAIETDEVGVVVYTANQLKEDGDVYGVPSRKFLGVCLETQGLPNAVNIPEFPSWVLEKNKPFSSVTKYYFGVK